MPPKPQGIFSSLATKPGITTQPQQTSSAPKDLDSPERTSSKEQQVEKIQNLFQENTQSIISLGKILVNNKIYKVEIILFENGQAISSTDDKISKIRNALLTQSEDEEKPSSPTTNIFSPLLTQMAEHIPEFDNNPEIFLELFNPKKQSSEEQTAQESDSSQVPQPSMNIILGNGNVYNSETNADHFIFAPETFSIATHLQPFLQKINLQLPTDKEVDQKEDQISNLLEAFNMIYVKLTKMAENPSSESPE